jgi:arsenite methyltransferase
MNDEQIKELVKSKYSQIAVSLPVKSNSCCGGGSGVTFDYTVMSDDYKNLDGYFSDADLGLGCGLPTEYAAIKKGDLVLDLGSGAGNDVFVARKIVGETGKVTGLDMTEEMIKKAERNKEKLALENVDFVFGEIENMPLPDHTFDVVISNCVLNLVPDKTKEFSEIFRVLKNDGHFCVSDIVIDGILPDKLRDVAAFYTGCVAGALEKSEYLDIIEKTGFSNISIKKEKNINIPDESILGVLDAESLEKFKSSGTKILSITVTADK